MKAFWKSFSRSMSQERSKLTIVVRNARGEVVSEQTVMSPAIPAR